MADKYADFETLSRQETAGKDYRILARRAECAFAAVAPHGGGIEPGTSEIADAIAAERFSLYAFEGLKRRGNSDLHITSTRFDEPVCDLVLSHTGAAIAIHGERSTGTPRVFRGGLDDTLGATIAAALRDRGFDVRRHRNPALQGREPDNVCNRGIHGRGVQLELSRALRETMFASLTPSGRKHPTSRFLEFVEAVRSVLDREVDTCQSARVVSR